jgi:arginine exporter protein ArgO
MQNNRGIFVAYGSSVKEGATMVLILLLLVLAALPLVFLNSFGKVALISTYAGLAHLLVLVGIIALMWFGLHHKAIFRVWQRRKH